MKFRNWFLSEEEGESNIRHLIDSQGLILFFKKDGDYFGAGEDGRIVFARIKNPDEDTPEGWEDEASFTASNLTKMLNGEPGQQVFNSDSIKKIKVVDVDDVVKNLKNHSSPSHKASMSIIRLMQRDGDHDRDEAPNFNRADEE